MDLKEKIIESCLSRLCSIIHTDPDDDAKLRADMWEAVSAGVEEAFKWHLSLPQR